MGGIAPVEVQRPQRWDEPFGSDMTDAAVDRILTTSPFDRIDPRRFPHTLPLRELLKNDTRIVQYRAGDIVVRRGDYGSSAFFTLSGSLRVEVDVTRSAISEAMLGRGSAERKDWRAALAQLWTNAKWPEVRRARKPGAASGALVKSRPGAGSDVRLFLEDIPAVLTNTMTILRRSGQWFGLVAALGRAPHAATIFAETDAELLEIRWQGLRDIRTRAPEIREDIDKLYREQSLKTHLRETPMFSHLREDELEEVAAQTEFITYGSFDWYGTYKSLAERSAADRLRAEPIIAEEGHYPNGVILVRSGFARVTRRFGHGHRTVKYLGRGRDYGFEEIASNWQLERKGPGGGGEAPASEPGGVLTVVQGTEAGRRFELTAGVQVVGRQSDAAIAIADLSISRAHCEIEAQRKGKALVYTLRDCGSTNGTYLNGKRIEAKKVQLTEGDQVAVGQVVLRFSVDSSAGASESQRMTELMKTGLVPLHETSRVVRTGRVPLQHTLRAIGYVDILLVPTPVIERYVLRAIPAAELPPIIKPEAQTATEEILPDDAASRIGADMLEFMVENRFINGTAMMLMDLDRCTRCDDCVRACAATHDGNPRFLRHGPQIGHYMVANACMHCEDPVCMIGCPTGAIHRDATGGEVDINDATCIGCATCANSCPYQNIRMVEVRDEAGAFLLDDTTRAPILRATKCNLCRDQITGPACQHACPHDALKRVDMRDLAGLASWLNR